MRSYSRRARGDTHERQAGGALRVGRGLRALTAPFGRSALSRGPWSLPDSVQQSWTPSTRVRSAIVLGDAVCDRIATRFTRWLERRGLVTHAPDHFNNEAPEQSALDNCAQLSLGIGQLTSVPAQRLQLEDEQEQIALAKLQPPRGRRSRYLGEAHGFGLHAAVCVPAGNRFGRELLLRYCGRCVLAVGVVGLGALTACGSSSNKNNGGTGGSGGSATGGSGGTAGASGAAGAAGTAGAGGAVNQTIATAIGTITIKESDPGISLDCSQTLQVDGVQDDSEPWQAPQAKLWFRATPNVTSSTCPKNPSPPLTFAFGWGSGKFFYGPGFNAAIEPGTATVQGNTVTLGGSGSLPDRKNGTIAIAVSGSLTLGTTQGDPLGGWRPSSTYSCGWPKTNPPAYTGGYQPKIGDALPDGVFTDQCNDKVRLQDLEGRYLVIQENQTTSGCPPCSQAAGKQKQFEADMKAAGIDTLVVTLLVPSYTTPYLSPTLNDLKSYVSGSSTSGVALADRGFGVSVLASLIPNPQQPGALGFPAFLLIAPDGKILWGAQGFGNLNNVWTTLETKIFTNEGIAPDGGSDAGDDASTDAGTDAGDAGM